MSDQNKSIGTEAAWIAFPAELEAELNNILAYWEQIFGRLPPWRFPG